MVGLGVGYVLGTRAGREKYDQMKAAVQKLWNDPRVQQTRRVGQRIAAAATQWLNENNMSSRVAGFDWQFNVVNDETVNAWCMPGGKVVVYTGILPVTQDETGLAVVMGHEVSHAIARHGNERMSQGLALQFGGVAL
ncbi:MAG TPA: M48 family metallopeptidase, partial [Flavobacteriales bacterium]|nr:M48 family metallopeptidase [Flavobacteriales bacterium]